MSEIIRVEEDGVEFFTVTATGESGMSQSGLAKLCDVDKSTIGRLVENLLRGIAPNRLKPWLGKDLHLLQEYTKRGVDILPAVERRGFQESLLRLPLSTTRLT